MKRITLLTFLLLSFSAFSQDDCATATPLTVDTECNLTTYSTDGLTDSGLAGECGFYQGTDMWFSFTAPADGSFAIYSDRVTSGFRPVVTLYSGACGSLTPLDCNSGSSPLSNSGGLVFADPSLGGQTLTLRVFRYNSDAVGEFGLCVFDTTPPTNDECENAIPLTVKSDFIYDIYSNQYATDSDIDGPGCGFYQGTDIWFTVDVPADGQFVVRTTDDQGIDPVLTLYSGTCGSLVNLGCSGSSSPNGNTGQFIINDASLGGETLYVRMHRYNSPNGNDFEIVAVDVTAPSNDFCDDAIPLTFSTTPTFTTFSNIYATESGDPSPGCGFYNGADVWFSLTTPADGQFVITTTDNAGIDPVISLYSGSCGAIELIDCSGSSSPDGNTGQLIFNDASLGSQDLLLRVHRYNSRNGGDFEVALLDVTSPVNDHCENATPLSLVPNVSFDTYSNLYATDTDEPGPGCGFYNGADVWFTFTAPIDGQFSVVTTDNAGIDPVVSIYTGTCETKELIECSGNSSLDGNTGQLIINQADLGGEEILLRVNRYNSGNGGNFEMQVRDTTSPDNDFCENALPLAIAGSCTMTTYTNQWATDSQGVPSPGCGFNSRGDVWFTFTMPAENLFIESENLGFFSPVLSLYTGDCEDLNQYDCSSNGSATNSGFFSINDPALYGQQVYLRAVSYNNRNGNDFGLCVYKCGTDLNNDQVTDSADLVLLISDIGCSGSGCADINGDNETDSADLVALLAAFGSTC